MPHPLHDAFRDFYDGLSEKVGPEAAEQWRDILKGTFWTGAISALKAQRSHDIATIAADLMSSDWTTLSERRHPVQ